MKDGSGVCFSVFQAIKKLVLDIFCCSIWGIAMFGGVSFAVGQTTGEGDTVRVLRDVVIAGGRAAEGVPVMVSTLDREQIEEGRIETSLPFIVGMEPSVVASGENGTVGNTSLRIRGVDGTRINVNINGITLNDAESQMVYWVNIPNLAGMAQSLQVQRGIGSTDGGAASLGGAVNLQTLNSKGSPWAEADLTVWVCWYMVTPSCRQETMLSYSVWLA